MFRDLKRKAAEKAAALKGGDATDETGAAAEAAGGAVKAAAADVVDAVPEAASDATAPDDAAGEAPTKKGLAGRLAAAKGAVGSAREAVAVGAQKVEQARRKVAATKAVVKTAARAGRAARELKERAAAAGGVAAAGAESLKRARGRVVGSFKSPRTREEKGLTGKKIVFLCARCEREAGVLRKHRWEKTLKSMKSTSKAGWGMLTGSPTLIFSGGANAVGALVGRGDSTRQQADAFLSQCGYCGEWVCDGCWDPGRDACTACAQ